MAQLLLYFFLKISMSVVLTMEVASKPVTILLEIIPVFVILALF